MFHTVWKRSVLCIPVKGSPEIKTRLIPYLFASFLADNEEHFYASILTIFTSDDVCFLNVSKLSIGNAPLLVN